MLDVLVGSRPRSQVRPLGGIGSILVHALILTLAAAATAPSPSARPVPIADTTLVFLRRLSPPAVRPATMPGPRGLRGNGTGNATLIIATDPPPKGFQTILAPTDIPTTIPAVDMGAKPLDPRDYTGRGIEGGRGLGVVGGTGRADAEEPTADLVYLATTDDARFEPAVLLSQPIPRYPPALRDAGVSGRVLLQFIVNITGRVDSTSIKVVESTHDGFVEPARESVAAAIFRPARLGSTLVRQRAQQPIRFIATRAGELPNAPAE